MVIFFFVVEPAKLLQGDQNKPAEEVNAEGCERKARLYLKLLSSAFTAASKHQAEQKQKRNKKVRLGNLVFIKILCLI